MATAHLSFIDAAGEKLLIVLNPEHVRKILRSSNELDANPSVHEKIMGQLVGSPKSAIDYYRSPESIVDHDQMMQVRQHTPGWALEALDDKLFKKSTDTLLLGLPRFMASEAFRARDRLLAHFQSWGREADLLRIHSKVDPNWDPVAGSTLMQERESLYASLPGHGLEGRATKTLVLLYAGTSLMVPVTFWFLYETPRSSPLRRRVQSELSAHRDPALGTYDFAQLAATHFLQSLYAEAVRKYSASLVARQVVSPVFALDERYVIKQGTTGLIPSKYAAQYTMAWAFVHPALVEKPLSEFWGKRLLVSGAGGKERFSDAGLAGKWTSFGGGEHKCPGRFFARGIGIVTLSILLGEYEVEVIDPEAARKLDPVHGAEAFGTMRRSGKIGARTRRRHT
ncbi:Cholesterol 7-alpha-monooxygenase [Didymella heteroderae]|uniref:Cholesterol 7-alpha-monooxygenase n=1 Tax=Didymella heteroderae TaxID=1769908 RepID=A0A9P4WNF2_9PLEO|nr:Cholesterol 7-alpha-monooxygenase [Didymella heteroderae]